MKLILLPFMLCILFLTSSCQDDSLNPLPVKVAGQYMRLDITRDRIDANDISNSSFGGTLSNPSGNVVRYELFVRRSVGGIVTSDYIPLQTITTFPYELSVTPAMIAAAYNIDVSQIGNGEFYRFIAYSYDAAGNKAGYYNLSRTVRVTPTMKEGYRFNTSILTDLNVIYNNYQP